MNVLLDTAHTDTRETGKEKGTGIGTERETLTGREGIALDLQKTPDIPLALVVSMEAEAIPTDRGIRRDTDTNRAL